MHDKIELNPKVAKSKAGATESTFTVISLCPFLSTSHFSTSSEKRRLTLLRSLEDFSLDMIPEGLIPSWGWGSGWGETINRGTREALFGVERPRESTALSPWCSVSEEGMGEVRTCQMEVHGQRTPPKRKKFYQLQMCSFLTNVASEVFVIVFIPQAYGP